MDPLAVLAYGAEHASPLIGMEWNGMEWKTDVLPLYYATLRPYVVECDQ